MAILANRARVATATTGTGTITLGAASTGYQTFADAGVANGQRVSYVIEDGSAWEVGSGIYTTAGTTLTRTVLESSNADSAISLSGSAVVFITALKQDLGELLGVSAVRVTHTGNTTETALATITIPANSMGANGFVRIHGVWVRTAGTAGIITSRIRFSSLTGTIYITQTMATTQSSIRANVDIMNRNATNSQVGGVSSGGGWASATGVANVSAVDTTAATTVVLSGQHASAADTLGLESYIVQLFYRA